MAGAGFDDRERSRLAGTFGAAAERYQRGRPDYPEAALDWLLEPVTGARPVDQPVNRYSLDVCDLGAGTGKLTRSLVERGARVTAVEPSGPMLDLLRRSCPGARAQLGSAEATGLDDASMDAVLVAQAWHWVDPVRAVPEVARVLRDGGVLGLVWNLRTDTTPFARDLEQLMGGSERHHWGGIDQAGQPDSPFAAGDHRVVEWTDTVPAERLVDLVASRSYVIAMDVESRARLLDQVDELGRQHAIDGSVRLPYRTQCLRYRRVER